MSCRCPRERPDTVGQPTSKFYEYFLLGKFSQLFCLQRRHVGHTNFGAGGLANSIRRFSETSSGLNLRVYGSDHEGRKPTVPPSRWERQSSRLSESPHPPGGAAMEA